MKKRSIGMFGAGLALALASALGAGQVAQSMQQPQQAQQGQSDLKATPPKARQAKTKIVNEVGGLQLMQGGVFGLTPREYGLRFGNGASRKGKKNYLRMAHNAKVSKRINRA